MVESQPPHLAMLSTSPFFILPASATTMARGKGRTRASTTVVRDSPRQHAPASAMVVEVGSSARGGAAGRGRGRRGARGRGGQSRVLVIPPPATPPLAEGHTGDTPLEFVVELCDPCKAGCGSPSLCQGNGGRPTARPVVGMNGYCNGAVWVNVEFHANGIMYLTRG
jgi:hypothetical protein